MQTIGKESAGKSSIVENALKYEVFPRARGIMTKSPVRFETSPSSENMAEVVWRGVTKVLDSKEGILEEVKKIMVSLGGEWVK